MINQSTHGILTLLKQDLAANRGKISSSFVEVYSNMCTYEYGQTGDSCRTCVLTTTNGNKIVGHSLVLDPNNDVEEIGNKVAREKCVEQLWSFLGGLAKCMEL